jgi:hypothetical protein
MQLDLMQSVADMAANAFVRWLNSPSTSSSSRSSGPDPERLAAEWAEKRRAAEAEEKRRAEEWRAKVQGQIREMQEEYAKEKRKETEERKTRILAGLKGMGGGSAGADVRREKLRRLACASWYSRQAAEAARGTDGLESGKLKRARELSRLAMNPPAGECAGIPEPPLPPDEEAVEVRIGLYETMIEEIDLRLPLVEEARAKLGNAAAKVREKQEKVDGLKGGRPFPAPAGEGVPSGGKEADDPLLKEAMKELEAARTLEAEARGEAIRLDAELDALTQVRDLASATGMTGTPGEPVPPGAAGTQKGTNP